MRKPINYKTVVAELKRFLQANKAESVSNVLNKIDELTDPKIEVPTSVLEDVVSYIQSADYQLQRLRGYNSSANTLEWYIAAIRKSPLQLKLEKLLGLEDGEDV